MFRAANGVQYLFVNLESDYYAVFEDEKSFLVVNLICAARNYRVQDSDSVLSRCVGEEPLLTLTTFGGRIVLFDASLGHKEVQPYLDADADTDDTAHSANPLSMVVLCVPIGTWQAYAARFKNEKVSLWGVFFRLATD
jgi:hypothetical protein